MDIDILIWSISVTLSVAVIIILLYCNLKSVMQKSRLTKFFAAFNVFGILAQSTVFLDHLYDSRPYLYAIFTTLILVLFTIGNKNFMVLRLLEIDYPLNGTPFGRIIAIGIGLMLVMFYTGNFLEPASRDLQFITFLVWSLLIVVLDYSQAILLLNISLDEQVAATLGAENVGLILIVALTKPIYFVSLGFFVLQYFYLHGYFNIAINILGIQMIIAEQICLHQETATLIARELLPVRMESIFGDGNRSSDRTRKISIETLV